EGAAEEAGNKGRRGFLDFLKRVYRRFPGWELHVMADAPMADAPAGPWLASKRRLRVHYLPQRAFWLNHMEVWLKVFAREAPGGGLWADKEELTGQIMARIKASPDSWAKPFRWTCE
ncbi:MAG: IS630 family transposase, partial [Deltaproteobacteria bacterium]|nr:IS630 family transposase [Deltaproteobacteria bacterium]